VAVRVGVIAEEGNDVEVLYEFSCKLVPENSFRFKKFVGHGCGTLRRKCRSWARNLVESGCTHLVVLHDLDARDEEALRNDLEAAIGDLPFSAHVILIPIQEIEAWLLCDAMALRRVFHMNKTPRVPQHPESISSPKEYPRNLVWKSCRKRYLHTIHNKRVAREADIDRLEACPSFALYPSFIQAAVNP